MASPLTLDLESLLAPIPGPAPFGADPRSDTAPTSPYQLVKDARYAAADAERGLERGFAEAADAKRAEASAKQSWPLILASGTALIASTAKDLEVAAWVTEALLRLHRIAGLRDGPRALMAMGMLVGRLGEDALSARREFAERFAAFASKRQRQLVKQTFG